MLQKALKYLLHPTSKGIEDNALFKKVAIAQRLILITTLITIGYFFYYLSKNVTILAYTGLWDIAGYILCFILLKKGHLQTSRNLFVVFLNFNLFYSSLILGQEYGNQFWYIPVAAGTLIFFDSKESKGKYYSSHYH